MVTKERLLELKVKIELAANGDCDVLAYYSGQLHLIDVLLEECFSS